MERSLFEILACPICKGELDYRRDENELICHFDQLAFPIINDIPVMLEAKARRVTNEE